MRGFLYRAERNKPNLVKLTRLLKRPPNARIARQPLAAIVDNTPWANIIGRELAKLSRRTHRDFCFVGWVERSETHHRSERVN